MSKLVRLQGFGWYEGKPAGEIKVGDKIWWNFGGSSVVKSVVKETAKTIRFTVECEGKEYTRQFSKSKLLVY